MHTAMLRIARIDTPGLLHHVMIRGIERREIVDDRNRFVLRMGGCLQRQGQLFRQLAK